ncbi:MAG TPA: hypothetical protein VNU00_04030 [Candidatus Binataceae bacterium]|nr:hypothetical protein [Candidatus Binataceae bacterium]
MTLRRRVLVARLREGQANRAAAAASARRQRKFKKIFVAERKIIDRAEKKIILFLLSQKPRGQFRPREPSKVSLA